MSRLPSVEDTYLFHCVAPENPADERLVALAEVRDLTPVRDASGALDVPPRGRAHPGRVPRGHPPEPGRAAREAPPAGQPRLPLRLARRGGAAARADGGGAAARPHDRGARARGGAPVLRRRGHDDRRGARGGPPLLVPAGRRGRACGSPGRRPSPCRRSTTTPRACWRPGGAAPSTPTSSSGSSPETGATSSSTTSTRTGGSCRWIDRRGATGRASWPGSSAPRPRSTRRASCASRSSATPRARSGSVAEPECARIIAAIDLAERDGRAGRVVRDLVRREDLARQRHREHGLGLAGAAPPDHVHPGGRRGQRGRRRHQRRRAAVLERRGDDAAAHPGHPRHDARQRDGAHRQAGPRLLRRGLGRGQLRHRRVRPDHGPERAGPVLGAPSRRRVRRPVRPLRPHLRRSGRAVPAPGHHDRPGRSRRARLPPLGPGDRPSRRSETSSRP